METSRAAREGSAGFPTGLLGSRIWSITAPASLERTKGRAAAAAGDVGFASHAVARRRANIRENSRAKRPGSRPDEATSAWLDCEFAVTIALKQALLRLLSSYH
jgi:hypothetical protein